jgi:hypothetical protein
VPHNRAIVFKSAEIWVIRKSQKYVFLAILKFLLAKSLNLARAKKKVIGRKYCTLSFWQLFFHIDENFEFFSFLVTSQI